MHIERSCPLRSDSLIPQHAARRGWWLDRSAIPRPPLDDLRQVYWFGAVAIVAADLLMDDACPSETEAIREVFRDLEYHSVSYEHRLEPLLRRIKRSTARRSQLSLCLGDNSYPTGAEAVALLVRSFLAFAGEGRRRVDSWLATRGRLLEKFTARKDFSLALVTMGDELQDMPPPLKGERAIEGLITPVDFLTTVEESMSRLAASKSAEPPQFIDDAEDSEPWGDDEAPQGQPTLDGDGRLLTMPDGTPYAFTRTQGDCIKVLWAAWQIGRPAMLQETILERANVETNCLREVFRLNRKRKKKNHPAWGTLIVRDENGRYRLNLPRAKARTH
jgi:hypothetical protein